MDTKSLKGQEKRILQALMEKTGPEGLSEKEKMKTWEDYKSYTALKKERGREGAILALPEGNTLKKLFSQVFLRKSKK